MATIRLHTGIAPADRPVRTSVIGPQLLPAELQFLCEDSRLQLSFVESLSALLADAGKEGEPELILLLQGWSDQFTSAQRDELLSRFPLARLICLYGPLCAADGRTRNIWNAALRVPLSRFPQRLELELAVLRGSAASLPLTATREEVFRFESEALVSSGKNRTPVASISAEDSVSAPPDSFLRVVYSPDRAWAETLADMALQQSRSLTLQVVTQSRELLKFGQQHPDCLLICDVDPLTPSQAAWWTKHRPLLPRRPLFVSSFPGRLHQFLQSSAQAERGADRFQSDKLLRFLQGCE